MKLCVGLAALAFVSLSAVSAEADHRWKYRKFAPWQERTVYWEEDSDDVVYYEDTEDEAEAIYQDRRRQKRAQRAEEDEIWWLEDNARQKLEQRAKKRKTVPAVKKAKLKPVAPAAKPKAKLAAKPIAQSPNVAAGKTSKPVAKPKLQTASLGKPVVTEKPRVVGKTIGCTAGAAVVTGYGFGEVKPRACTGATYAYTASRAGKIYEIQLTAASGEIIDVKKLN